jgi:hypothetical protein
MAEPDNNSIPALIRGLLEDTRDLIREEIALARAEIRDQIANAQTVAVAFGSAALAALLAGVLFCIALGGAIAKIFDLSAWAGYAIVGVLLVIAALVLFLYGQFRLARVRALPKTTETIKENLAWMQSKSAEK